MLCPRKVVSYVALGHRERYQALDYEGGRHGLTRNIRGVQIIF